MLRTLSNDFWQVGILPDTGASVAFGRVNVGGAWRDLLRPTPESDYGSSSACASFIMLPWCNRLRGGVFRFNGVDHHLRVNARDGTAIHGDVRDVPWKLCVLPGERLLLSYESAEHADVNFPFRFSAQAEYDLQDRDFLLKLAVRNEDEAAFPAGFGHHPYFVRTSGVQVSLPCDKQFELFNCLPVDEAKAPVLDFRQPRPLGDALIDDVFTARRGDAPARLLYEDFEATIHSDPLYEHIVLYAPPGKPFYAVEPVTNVNDGFNLFARGVNGTGVFVLQPGEERRATIRIRMHA